MDPTTTKKPNVWGADYVLLDDAAAILGISRRTLYNHQKAGELEFKKLAGKNYVVLPSILRYFGKSIWDFKMQGWTYNPETGRYETRPGS